MTIILKDIRVEDFYAPYFEESYWGDEDGKMVDNFEPAILFTYVIDGEEHAAVEWLTNEGELISGENNWRCDAKGLNGAQVEDIEDRLRVWMKENDA